MSLKKIESLPLGYSELDVLYKIAKEYVRAVDKHPNWPVDPIHQAAIVQEECGELIQAAVQHVYENGEFEPMHEEAIHTGAMAMRFLVNAKDGSK